MKRRPFLRGFSPLRFLNGRVRVRDHDPTHGITFGDLPRQRLDVYRRPGATTAAPVVIFFYGGSWQQGERADYVFVADALVSRGFVPVVPDYRVHPEARFPAFVEDGAAVVCWARDHVASFGGDPERIFLMGHSAGAHIAALLALDDRYLRAVGLDRSALRGIIGIAGPYDFLPFKDDVIRTLMGPAESWPETQPINFVTGDTPPMLLLHGGRDATVGAGNTVRLARSIRERGGRVESRIYRHLNHQLIIGAFGRPLRFLAPVLRDVSDFVHRNSLDVGDGGRTEREATG